MRGIRLLLAAIFAAAIIAGGGYYGYQLFVRDEFQTGLDQVLTQLPPGYSAKYASVTYSVLSGQGSVTGLTVHKGAPDPFDLTIDRIEVNRPNLGFAAAWTKAAKNPASVSREFAIPLAARISATGMKLHADMATASVGSMEVEGARVYPWSLLRPDLPSMSEAVALFKTLAQAPEPGQSAARLQALQPLFRLMAAWTVATGYDRFTQRDAALTLMMATPQHATPVTMHEAIRLVRGAGAERGVVAEGVIEGYAVTSSTGIKISVERVRTSQLDMRKPLDALLTPSKATPDMFDGSAIGRIAYDGMRIAVPGLAPMTIDSFSISKLLFSGGVPVTAAFEMNGITLKRADLLSPQGQDAFARLGLDHVTISAALAYHWNLAQKQLAVPDFMLKLDGLGTLDLSADLDDVAPGAAAAFRARLRHAVLRYTDDSLVERMVRAQARNAQIDPALYRQRLAALIQTRAAAYPDSAALQAAAKAFIAFLDAPKSLKIELAPPKPVPLVALLLLARRAPPQFAAMLGLSVTANP